MLYIFHGDDTATSAKKMTATIANMRVKRPDAEFFRIEDGKLDANTILELVGGAGLFSQKYIVEIQYPLERVDTKDVFMKYLDSFAESDNVFLVLEKKILKSDLTKIEKRAEKVFEHNVTKSEKKSFNTFNLADCVGSRDKKKGWVLLQEAFKQGIEPEAIHGILWWQVKSMYSTLVSKKPLDVMMKDFPYNKAKRSAQNFTKEEIEKMMKELVEMSHEAHAGNKNFEHELEKFILSL